MTTTPPSLDRKAALARAAIDRARHIKAKMEAQKQAPAQPQDAGTRKPLNLFGWRLKKH